MKEKVRPCMQSITGCMQSRAADRHTQHTIREGLCCFMGVTSSCNIPLSQL